DVDVSNTCADLIAQADATTWDVPVAVTRVGNFYCGGDLNFSRLVPGVLRDVLHGRRPVIRSDVSFIRDYIHVEDGVSAYLATAEALAARPELAGRAFNFSLERPLSVLELVKEVQRAAGSDIDPEILNTATKEIHAQ